MDEDDARVDLDPDDGDDVTAAELSPKPGGDTPEDYLLLEQEQAKQAKAKPAPAKPPARPAPRPGGPPVATGQPAQRVRLRMFPAISYKSFTYPKDEETLEAVKRIPGVPKLFDWIIDNLLEEYLVLNHLYNSTRCDAKQYPSVWNTVRKACKILDCPVPEVYVSYNTGFNAITSGVDRTFVCIGSRLVDIFPPDELMFIIGHELGHIKANHVLYKTVTRFIIEFLPVLQSMIPFNVGFLYRPMLIALAEWDRRSEFTCDRAGLLTCQDLNAATSALAWFAGKLRRRQPEYSLDALNRQAGDVRSDGNQLARLMLFLSSMHNTHPYAVMRVKELSWWHGTDAYQNILKGTYIRDAYGEHEAGKRMACPGCRREVNTKLEFCPHCGAGLRSRPASAPPAAGPICPKCQAPVGEGASFCSRCGEKLG
ncbi:M48 family metallopeptidase [bacterium]|nr:M48 family metallopeptidase [bacterium]